MVNHLIPQDKSLYNVLDKLFENDMYECLIPEGDKTVKDNVDKIYEILIKEFPILLNYGNTQKFTDKVGSLFNRFSNNPIGFTILWFIFAFIFVFIIGIITWIF